MAKAAEWGFVPMMPPALVKPEAMDGTGFLGQAADDVYHLPKDDLYLVGTSRSRWPPSTARDPGRRVVAAPLCRVQPVLPA
jgi:hypothetical protein